MTKEHILNNPVWAALKGPQENFAQIHGDARKYQPEISPFVGIADVKNPTCWNDLKRLMGAGATVVLTGPSIEVPAGWEVTAGGTGLQMTGENVIGSDDFESVELTKADVPEMLDLVSRTQPGPFMRRTVELGGYRGFRNEGKLVAMAGRRMHPPGWVEISAVCTDQDFQGRGYAGRLVKAIAATIQREGSIPFLHVSESNRNAIRLYEKLGFTTRTVSVFKVLTVPE